MANMKPNPIAKPCAMPRGPSSIRSSAEVSPEPRKAFILSSLLRRFAHNTSPPTKYAPIFAHSMPVAAPRMIHASIGFGLLIFITKPTGISTMQLEVNDFTDVLSARRAATGVRFTTVPTSRRDIFTATASFVLFFGECCFFTVALCKKENLRAVVALPLAEASTAKSTSSSSDRVATILIFQRAVGCSAEVKPVSDLFSKRGEAI
mmetsp:Transcript_30723/g.67864  ORF Transcript_30723/g.67864 Transcript_30723/m.67864 type:complete len:206 (-) Transcript_30723:54-671(-)